MTELDYYGVLGLTPSCSDLDVKRAFRRLAIQLHPQRGRQGSAPLFALAAEAYDVLSDPHRRAVYDQFGEAGLKRGWPPHRQPYVYHGDPLRTYRHFFGTDSPYADLLDVVLHPPDTRVKAPDHRRPLPLTIDEVFHGALKKVSVSRRVLMGVDGATTEARTEVLKVAVRPGLPAGTQFRFPEMGNQGLDVIPPDLILITEDRPHPRFSREGDNLVMVHTLGLKDALTGCTVIVDTLNGKTLRVPITEVAHTKYEKVVTGEGMPSVTDRSRRGDLVIRFNITFPEYVSVPSRRLIREALKNRTWRYQAEDIHRIIMQDKMRRITNKEFMKDKARSITNNEWDST